LIIAALASASMRPCCGDADELRASLEHGVLASEQRLHGVHHEPHAHRLAVIGWDHEEGLVIIYLQAESLDALRTFAAAPELKAVMKAAGVLGAPDITFVTGGVWAH